MSSRDSSALIFLLNHLRRPQPEYIQNELFFKLFKVNRSFCLFFSLTEGIFTNFNDAPQQSLRSSKNFSRMLVSLI